MIDIYIVAGYLLLMLAVGWYSGQKIKSLSDYAVGGRTFGTFAITATLFATFIGGASTIGTAEKVFTMGLAYVLIMRGCSVQQILVGTLIAPKMKNFKGVMTVGDIMERLYGKSAKIVTGFASVLLCAGIVGAQVGALGYVFHTFFDMPMLWGSLLGCAVVIFYTSFGGIRSVIITDLLQFAILIVAIPMVLYLGLEAVGGMDRVVEAVPTSHMTFFGEMGFLKVATLFLALLLGDMLIPPYMQRLFAAKSPKSAGLGTMWSGILSFAFYGVVGWIGLVALTLSPDLAPKMAMPHLIQEVLPVGIRGLAIAGILAVVMSSADSYLNAAGTSLVHDIIEPLYGKGMREKSKVLFAKLLTVTIGLVGIIVSLSFESILDIMLYVFNFWAPIMVVPLVAGLFGLKASPKAFFASAVLSGLTVLIWDLTLESMMGIDGLMPGLLVSFISFTLVRTFEPRKVLAVE